MSSLNNGSAMAKSFPCLRGFGEVFLKLFQLCSIKPVNTVVTERREGARRGARRRVEARWGALGREGAHGGVLGRTGAG